MKRWAPLVLVLGLGSCGSCGRSADPETVQAVRWCLEYDRQERRLFAASANMLGGGAPSPEPLRVATMKATEDDIRSLPAETRWCRVCEALTGCAEHHTDVRLVAESTLALAGVPADGPERQDLDLPSPGGARLSQLAAAACAQCPGADASALSGTSEKR